MRAGSKQRRRSLSEAISDFTAAMVTGGLSSAENSDTAAAETPIM
jgi:hypothetical protein